MKKIPRVLLVDDDGATNFLNKDMLANYNFAEKIIVKTNGRDALAFLEKECKLNGQYPNLIFLDLRMPDFDGFEFLQEFQRMCTDVKQDMYVVILTCSNDADDVIKLKQFGNFHWVQKPLTPDKIVDIHHKFFRKSLSLH